MIALEFPQSPFKPEDLADWLELTAIFPADKNASAGDVERGLNLLNHPNAGDLLGNMLTEIDRRNTAAGEYAYPFIRQNTSVELKPDPHNYPAYIFCLALSYFAWKTRKGARHNPWLLFEELASYSAKNYLGGDVIVFGTSNREGKDAKNAFQANIKSLAKILGEGSDFPPQKTFSTKDSKLDLVAWKRFSDRRASQIIIFGQCAAGANWNSKLSELDPDVFWDQWMSEGKVSALLRSVFIPHRIFEDQEWSKHARHARLLFDRCRVASLAHNDTKEGTFADRLLGCCRTEWKIPV